MSDDIIRTRPPDFKKYYGTKIFGGLTGANDIRLEIINEKLKEGDRWVYLVETQIILTPKAAKEALHILSLAVEEYEREFGEIKMDDSDNRTY